MHQAQGEGARSVEGDERTDGIPSNDPDRAIEATGLLDTPREERFDRFTQLARTIWGVPMASINLFDHDRTFFKSTAGLGDLTQARTSDTFCETTRQQDAPLVVTDAHDDPAFASLPAVSDFGLRFYAGHPIRDQHGTTLGTLCLYDANPRTFDEHDLSMLAQLATCVEDEVRLSSDRERATSVQQALLPRDVAPVPGYSFAATCVATGLVAGDAFDHRELEGGHYLLVADVMGKGTAAAILMASVRSVIRSEMRRFAAADPATRGTLGDVLERARDVVQDDLDAAESFVTAFLGWADPRTGTMSFADAGHGLSVVVHPDGSTTSLSSKDLPLGVDPGARWEEHQVELEPGDVFVCFSDGLLDVVPEVETPSVAVARLVADTGTPHALVREVERLALDVPVRDDVTVLAVRKDDA
jgi:hypothetical protein